MAAGLGVRLLCLLLLATPIATAAAEAAALEAALEEPASHQALQRVLRSPAGAGVIPAGDRTREAIRQFYAERSGRPVWSARPAQQRDLPDRLLAAIRDGGAHGLAPWRYQAARIEDLLARRGKDAAASAELELLLTEAFVAQAIHRSAGVLNPDVLSQDWSLRRAQADPFALLERVAEGESPASLLDALWPAGDEYRILLNEALRLTVEEGGEDDAAALQIPPGELLRPGMQDTRVPALRRRLALDEREHERVDAELAAAIVAFQAGVGLEPDGVVGPATLAALNRTRAQRLGALQASLERLRWLPRRWPAEYLRINVPDFSLIYVRDHDVVVRADVIVGRPDRPTPIMGALLRYVVFNPDWVVPRKLAVEDKLPLLRRDAEALARQGYQVAPLAAPTEFVSVADIDWSRTQGFPFVLRQLPGPQNALGRVKLMLPNEHSVYLHDTCNPELFARVERPFSAGCIRVARPFELVERLFDRQPDWSRARIDAAVASGRTIRANLLTPVAVYVVYLAAFTDADGVVRYRRDLYGLDGPLLDALLPF
jgi:L,D-transpeptidase YcbB